MDNQLAGRYLRRISQRLPVGGEQKKEFLATLQDSLERHLREYPETDLAGLEAAFGTPDEIADDFISQMPSTQINRRFHARDRVIAIVGSLAAAIAITWTATVTSLIADGVSSNDGHTEVTEAYHIQQGE